MPSKLIKVITKRYAVPGWRDPQSAIRPRRSPTEVTASPARRKAHHPESSADTTFQLLGVVHYENCLSAEVAMVDPDSRNHEPYCKAETAFN